MALREWTLQNPWKTDRQLLSFVGEAYRLRQRDDKGIQNVTPAHAIEMSQNEPKVVRAGNKDERAGNSRAIRYKMLKGRTFVKCHWCDTMIDLNTSTIEHIVPLDRGGLENANNRTLACKPCNEGRGNSMPELQTVKSKPWEN